MIIGFNTNYEESFPTEKVAFFASLGTTALELFVNNEERLDNYIETVDSKLVRSFAHRTIHMPCSLQYGQTTETHRVLKKIEEIYQTCDLQYAIIHPDVVDDWGVFAAYDMQIAVENMDVRKDSGTTVAELVQISTTYNYPVVIDINHCKTIDESLQLAQAFYTSCKGNILEVHVSGYIEGHEPLIETGQSDIVTSIRGWDVPIIIESVIQPVDDVDRYKKEMEFIKNILET